MSDEIKYCLELTDYDLRLLYEVIGKGKGCMSDSDELRCRGLQRIIWELKMR